jgi:hypothetical protein
LDGPKLSEAAGGFAGMERTGEQPPNSGYDTAAAGWGAPAEHPILAALGTVTDTYAKAVDASP